MKRYEISKEQWERIQPLLPPEKPGKRGRPRKDKRIMLNGMLWIARSGAQWRDDGTLEAVFHALSVDADIEYMKAPMAKKQQIRRLAVPEVSGTQSSTRSSTVWKTRRSSLSPLEMTTIRFALLNDWKKSGLEGVPYCQAGLMAPGRFGNISQRAGPVM